MSENCDCGAPALGTEPNGEHSHDAYGDFRYQIPIFGQADDRTLNQIRVCARTADEVALMPDNHVGCGVPIGGVVA